MPDTPPPAAKPEPPKSPASPVFAAPPAGAVVVQLPQPVQTAQDLGRPEGWRHDETTPGGRFIVNGVAVDANGQPHKDKATRDEVVASYRARGLNPPPAE